ncbi:murein biosynthesis integral membrane protein MurJ [Rugosimonospora africana]|nr:murein biosynthesis integral membrane protein MurJ [Rugosimonospora africana]
MAVATLASRMTGFVRVLVLTASLGLGGRLLDSYNVANAIPNAVFELIVGGAMASVVVPLLSRAAVTEHDRGVLYAQRLLALLAYVLGAIAALATLAAPYLVDLYTPGFTTPQRQLAVLFGRFFLPQILFYGMSAAAGAVLNMRDRFAAPMWAPVVNNLVVIAVGVTYVAIGGGSDLDALTGFQSLLLALGTTLGVAGQTAVVLWALRRSGFPLRPRWDPRGIGIRRIGRLGGWVLLAVAMAQVLATVATRLASTAGPGAVSSYQTAYALFQMPYAVVALSVMTAVLPRLSQHAARREYRRVVEELSRALRMAAVIVAPLAAAMVVFGPQVATLLFAHGHSVPSAVAGLGAAVRAFGLLLLPFAGYMILLRGFYAMQDTRTPALLTASVGAVGVIGCLTAYWLVPRHDLVVGLAVAYAVAYTYGLAAAGLVLRARLGRIDGRRLVALHARLAVAVLVAACVAFGTAHVIAGVVDGGWTGALAALTAGGAVGAAGYAAAAALLRLTELRQIAAMAVAGFRTG